MEWTDYKYEFEVLTKTFARIQAKKEKLDALRPLPTIAVKSIRESLALEWTYNSNAIEGNSLNLRETKMIVEEGFTVKGKSLREHFEALNHQDAIAWVENLSARNIPLTERDILEVHALVLQRIEKEFTGRYRNSGVRISGANFAPPNALKVNDLMRELLSWVNGPALALHPLVQASIFHHRFVWIHPFFDGNGRTARLIFNLLLLRDGYPPAIILKNDRSKYYDALNKANKGDYTKFVLLVVQATERSLNIYWSSLNNTNDDYQSISDIAGEPDMPYGQEYISLLARQGKIDAYKEGRNWLTTKAAVRNYIDLRERKRSI